MKTKQTILKAFASVALALGAFASADAQTNLGEACGCPAIADRGTPINLSSVAEYTPVSGTGGGKLSTKTLTCDKIWIIDVKIYVDNGNTLTINPGTLIKGNEITNPTLATALVIARGGKINAAGTESCPIVFTATADPMNGTYAVSNVGKWGGVVLLGRATNNLTLAANGPFVPGGAGKLAVADGLGTVEGFASSYALDQYGAAQTTPVAYVTAISPASPTYTFGQAASTAGNGTTTFTNLINQSSISITANGSYVLSGMSVSGTGIAGGTTVTNISSNVISLSTPTTGTVSGTITFTGAFSSPVSTSGQFFAGNNGTGLGTTSPFTSGFGPLAVATFTTNGTTYTDQLVNFAAPFIGAVGATGFDDNDNSGVMKYVSIRHSGAILSVGAEINGLTLASVGRGTTIDHIEIVSCADDNIEIFGGTVNLKYITTIFGNDDMFDYDLGWTGKAQFFFGMKNTTGSGSSASSPDNDNGIEADSDDNTSNSAIKSHPILYNFTIFGNGKLTPTSDNRGLAGVNFKEQSEGELYNSIFVNFKTGVNLIGGVVGGTPVTLANGRPFDTYDNWSLTPVNTPATSQSLKIKCNTFWMTGLANEKSLGFNASSSSANTGAPAAADITQFTVTDMNTVVTGSNAIPGLSYNFTIGANNAVTVKNDVTPIPALSNAGCPAFPVGDTFFTAAGYRGAFSSVNTENWLSDWSYSSVLNATKGLVPCPGDLNSDGTINIDDFLVFLPLFGTSCN